MKSIMLFSTGLLGGVLTVQGLRYDLPALFIVILLLAIGSLLIWKNERNDAYDSTR